MASLNKKTPPKQTAPENMPGPQKESNLPTILFHGQAGSFRGGYHPTIGRSIPLEQPPCRVVRNATSLPAVGGYILPVCRPGWSKLDVTIDSKSSVNWLGERILGQNSSNQFMKDLDNTGCWIQSKSNPLTTNLTSKKHGALEMVP